MQISHKEPQGGGDDGDRWLFDCLKLYAENFAAMRFVFMCLSVSTTATATATPASTACLIVWGKFST